MSVSVQGGLWFFIVWSEHFPNGLDDIKKCLRFEQCAISPEHNQDLDDLGNPKKPHYHVIINFGHSRSQKVVCAYLSGLFREFGGCNVGNFDNEYALQCVSYKPAVDSYLVHANDPDKAQYCIDDITCLNGYILEIGEGSIFVELMALVWNKKLNTLSDIAEWCVENKPEYLRYVFKYSYTLRSCLGGFKDDNCG